jgi:hypothetical protein
VRGLFVLTLDFRPAIPNQFAGQILASRYILADLIAYLGQSLRTGRDLKRARLFHFDEHLRTLGKSEVAEVSMFSF